jgi:redox-sensing transcriptional repressor
VVKEVVRLIQNSSSKKVYERLPIYLDYLNSTDANYISSTSIAKSLNLGEVQVRKDLALVSGKGRPKIGYLTENLIVDIKKTMGMNSSNKAVIVGFGKLGRALYEYPGFNSFGIEIVAAFDCESQNETVYDIAELESFCRNDAIKFGILTVPKAEAQVMAERLIDCGIMGIWNFTSERLTVPNHIIIQNENLAASLSVLVKETLDKKQGDM